MRMSINFGTQSPYGSGPFTEPELDNGGIIVAAGNPSGCGKCSSGLYNAGQPSELLSILGVGTVANKNEQPPGVDKYGAFFNDNIFSSLAHVVGDLVDYYSATAPVWLDYVLTLQLVEPGGHTISTWPLGRGGGYTILSGTSMAISP
ncbi:peptidase [Apiospora rasikravindrae]|uniref:Peptidase n=1 Tax=Apiospora rasikravindrae TaxID=990691 RepID=A0ABR1U045_9PEZI